MSATIGMNATENPTDVWWPSRYGADDRAGSLNEITPGARIGAARLVRTGRVFDLSHVLSSEIPAFEGRSFSQELDTPVGPIGRNKVGWIIERVMAPSQMGTHMDGLNHLHVDGRMYNGHRVDDISEKWGTSCCGADALPQVVARGLLLDVAAVRGVSRLGKGEVITPADAESALSAQDLVVQPGDALLFHTGWGRQWETDGAGYADGEPGPGTAMIDWLVDRRVSVTGCDTWSFGPVPAEDPEEPFVVPQTLNAKHGVVVLENLYLAELADARARQFLFVVSHAKLRGATGAWVAPLAIV
jgi:kynurenine formamidase